MLYILAVIRLYAHTISIVYLKQNEIDDGHTFARPSKQGHTPKQPIADLITSTA